MPIPKTYRVNILDLQPNVAIGVSIPFNGPAVFNSTYTTKEQVKYNIINYLLTNKGERIENPNFGSNLKKYVFEAIVDDNISAIRDLILDGMNKYIPEINILRIEIENKYDFNTINIEIDYEMKLSGDKDSIILNFE